MNKQILLAAAVMGLGIVGCGALPLPIQNGVLTGELNANGHSVTNVGSITFEDGTVQNTAGGLGAKTNSAFTGMVTNLAPATVVYATNTFIQIFGSGLAPVNDNTYATNASFGFADGYPIYVNASQTERISFWEAAPFGLEAGQSGWIIATNGYDQNGNTPVYFLAEGTAATPDQATNWISVVADSGGNLIPNPINNPPPTVISVQRISTNWVRHFNIATFTNGVCVTNTYGSITLNPIDAPGGSSGTATNLTGAVTNQINALALAQAQAVLGNLAPTNVPVNTVVSAGAGVTVVSNSVAGVQTYTVSGISSNTLLGMAGAVIAGSNYLTSASSNNIAGSLNAGQVYGLGTVAGLSSNAVLAMAGAAIAGSNYLTTLPGNIVTNGQANVVMGGASFTLTNASGTSATINLEAIPGIWQSLQASPSGLVAAGVLLNNGTLTANAINLNNGGVITGNGGNLTNTPGPIIAAGANVTVTSSTNATTGQITYNVASTGGGGGGGSGSGALNAPYALSSNTNLIVDPVNGNYQSVILTNNTTVTWTNVSGAWVNQGAFVRLEVFAGTFSLTWTTPTLATNLFNPSQLTTSNGIWNVYLIDKVAYGTANAKVYQLQ